MSVIISKNEFSTIIATENKKYTINQSPSKGIEILIGPIRPKSDDITIRLWLPVKTKSQEQIVENDAEISLYPIPLKVLEDIQERTNRELEIVDIAEEAGEEAGKEFYMRTKGYILMTTM